MSYDVSIPDPIDKSNSKALESIEFDVDFGGHVVNLDLAVPHKSVRPLSTIEETVTLDKTQKDYPGTLIQQDVTNVGNTNQSNVRKRYYPKNDGATVYPTKLARKVDRSALARFADDFYTRKEYVERESAIGTVDPLTIDISQELYAPNLDARSVTKATAFQDREDLDTDPDTGLMTKVITEVVYSLPTPAEQATGKGVTYREVASGIWIKETRLALKSDGSPINPGDNAPYYTFEWTTWEMYTMPGYMYLLESSGINQAFVTSFLPNQRRTNVLFRPPVRFPFNVLAEVRWVETHHAKQPDRPNLFNFAGKDWIHDGILANINIKGILMDSTTTVLSSLPGDTYVGAYTETVLTQETFPTSAFEYRNSIRGSFRSVEARVSRGPNKTFRMLTKRVRMQGNTTPQDSDATWYG